MHTIEGGGSSSSISRAEIEARLAELRRLQEEARRAREERARVQKALAQQAEEAARLSATRSDSKFESKVDSVVAKKLSLKPEAENLTADELSAYRDAVSAVARAQQVTPEEAVQIVENLDDPTNREQLI